MSETLEGSMIEGVLSLISAAEPAQTALNDLGVLAFKTVRFEKWRAPNSTELPACLVAAVETGETENRISLSEQYVDLVLQLRYSAELPDDDVLGETLLVLDRMAVRALKAAMYDDTDHPWSQIQFGGLVWEDESTTDLATLVRTIHVLYVDPDEPGE